MDFKLESDGSSNQPQSPTYRPNYSDQDIDVHSKVILESDGIEYDKERQRLLKAELVQVRLWHRNYRHQKRLDSRRNKTAVEEEYTKLGTVGNEILAVPPLVSVNWLKRRLDNLTGHVLLDCTIQSPLNLLDGETNYQKFHIKGARYFNLAKITNTSDISLKLPTPETFANHMSELNILLTDHLILYDMGAFCSSRAFWLLKLFKHPKVSLLHGGMLEFMELGNRICKVDCNPKYRRKETYPIPVELDTSLVKNYSDVLKVAKESENITQIVDVRPKAQFEGDEDGTIKSGHVPNAFNFPIPKLCDPISYTDKFYAKVGKFKISNELQEILLPINMRYPAICMCEDGAQATAMWYILRYAQYYDLDMVETETTLPRFFNVSVYEGSWQDYKSRPDALIESGEEREHAF